MPDQAGSATNARAGSEQVSPSKPFTCYICSEPSSDICLYCTKDACDNHLCRKCGRCSDCCACEVPIDEQRPATNQ